MHKQTRKIQKQQKRAANRRAVSGCVRARRHLGVCLEKVAVRVGARFCDFGLYQCIISTVSYCICSQCWRANFCRPLHPQNCALNVIVRVLQSLVLFCGLQSSTAFIRGKPHANFIWQDLVHFTSSTFGKVCCI